MYRDNYTNFSFDELQSENFKVWITNKNDIKRNMSPNFSDKFNTPTYGQIRYHEGTTIDKQDFKLPCVAVDVTLNEWRAITEWLSPLKSGKLRFDWNDKYYYMVKVSKAISGTMFVKGKIDAVMGQLYIITFDVEFTTVFDWAALGAYCEIGSTTTPELSVFNNGYYTPQIIVRKTQDEEKDYTAQQSTYGADQVKLYFQAGDIFTVYELIDDDLVCVGQVSQPSDGLYKYEYAINGLINEDSWEINLPVEVDSSDRTWAIITSNERQCFVHNAESGSGYKAKRLWNNNILFSNPSSYEMFPNFYMTNSVTLTDDRYTYTSYTIAEGVLPEDTYVILDNRNMTLTNGGKHLADKHDSYGANIFLDIQHNRQLVIPSGRPELYKVLYQGTTYTDNSLSGKPDTITHIFRLNDKPIYNRYKTFFMHIFKDQFVKDVNRYDIDSYNSKIYYQSMFNIDESAESNSLKYVHKYQTMLLDSPSIHYEKEDGKWYMYVTYFIEKENDLVKEVKMLKLNDPTTKETVRLSYSANNLLPKITTVADDIEWMYIAICDYESYNLSTLGDFSVGTQARDVI